MFLPLCSRYYVELCSGVHLRGLAPGRHNSKEHGNVGESSATLCRFNRAGIEPRPPALIAMCLTTELTDPGIEPRPYATYNLQGDVAP